MQIERDGEGRVVAVLTVEDTVDTITDRVGFAEALRAISGLIDQVCIDAGERGRQCPDAILIDFGKLSTFRWV